MLCSKFSPDFALCPRECKTNSTWPSPYEEEFHSDLPPAPSKPWPVFATQLLRSIISHDAKGEKRGRGDGSPCLARLYFQQRVIRFAVLRGPFIFGGGRARNERRRGITPAASKEPSSRYFISASARASTARGKKDRGLWISAGETLDKFPERSYKFLRLPRNRSLQGSKRTESCPTDAPCSQRYFSSTRRREKRSLPRIFLSFSQRRMIDIRTFDRCCGAVN